MGLIEAIRPVSSVTVSAGHVLVEVRPPGGLDPLLEQLARADVAIEMLQWRSGEARFLTAASAKPALERALGSSQPALAVRAAARVVAAGSALGVTAGIAHRALRALARANVDALHFGDSESSVSFVVAAEHAERAQAALCAELIPNAARNNAAIRLDLTTGRVEVRGRTVQLGARQSRILAFFMENGGAVLSTERVTRELYGAISRNAIAAVRVHVHNLRKKIEEDPYEPRFLVTVPEGGYLFTR